MVSSDVRSIIGLPNKIFQKRNDGIAPDFFFQKFGLNIIINQDSTIRKNKQKETLVEKK
jgi:hypothetical protein